MTSVENPCWVGCQTYIYSMPLWAQHLMVADSATVGFEHPYGIFLTLVEVSNTQSFKVKVWKRLVRTIKVWSYKTIEKAVVTVR